MRLAFIFAMAVVTAALCAIATTGCAKRDPETQGRSVDSLLVEYCNTQGGESRMRAEPCRIECSIDDGGFWMQRVPDETCKELNVAP